MNLRTLIDDIHWMYYEKSICEEANLQPKSTGLVSTVHIMSKGGAKHGPRVKVSNVAGRFAHEDYFTITVEQNPRIVGKCKISKEHLDNAVSWVKLNHDHLHNVWHKGDTMDIDDVKKGLNKLV